MVNMMKRLLDSHGCHQHKLCFYKIFCCQGICKQLEEKFTLFVHHCYHFLKPTKTHSEPIICNDKVTARGKNVGEMLIYDSGLKVLYTAPVLEDHRQL